MAHAHLWGDTHVSTYHIDAPVGEGCDGQTKWSGDGLSCKLRPGGYGEVRKRKEGYIPAAD